MAALNATSAGSFSPCPPVGCNGVLQVDIYDGVSPGNYAVWVYGVSTVFTASSGQAIFTGVCPGIYNILVVSYIGANPPVII